MSQRPMSVGRQQQALQPARAIRPGGFPALPSQGQSFVLMHIPSPRAAQVLSLMVVEGGLSTRYFTGGQLNALGQPERFSEMQWAFKSVVNEKGGAGMAAAAPAATAKGSVVGWRPPAAQKRQTAVRPA